MGFVINGSCKREKSIRPDIRNLLYNTDIRSRNTADIKGY